MVIAMPRSLPTTITVVCYGQPDAERHQVTVAFHQLRLLVCHADPDAPQFLAFRCPQCHANTCMALRESHIELIVGRRLPIPRQFYTWPSEYDEPKLGPPITAGDIDAFCHDLEYNFNPPVA